MLLWTTLCLGGLGLLAAGYRLARRRPAGGGPALAALLALLLLRALGEARPDWEFALLPWPDYAQVQGFTLYALAAAFFGLAAGRLPVRWNRGVVLAVGLAVLAHGAHRQRWLAWPERHGDGRTAGPDHHVRQSTHYTCGPAACLAVLSHCGVQLDERTMAQLCLTRREGSRLFDLYRGLVLALRGRPFAVAIEAMPAERLLAEDLLVVGHNAGGGHALAVVSQGGRLVVHDPLQPRAMPWTADELRAGFRGPAVVVRPTAAAPAPR